MMPIADANPDPRLIKFNRLVEVSLHLNSTLELKPLLRAIMDAAAEITEANNASILLVDSKTQELHFMAFSTEGSDLHTELRRIPVPLQGSIAGTVVLENHPIIINDVSQDPRHYRKTDDESGFRTESILGVPMTIKNRVIGVLEAVNKKSGEWTNDDVHFLEILSSQAAIAIENASLVSRLRTAYQDLSQLDKMKSDFIAIASHELRTPLGVILGYATFLKEDAQGDVSDHAEAVFNSAMKMRQIIEDMTNLRYLKIGKGELSLEVVPIRKLMTLAVKDSQTMTALDKPIQVTAPEEDISIQVDLSKMVMAIENILSNAIKFTPEQAPIHFYYERHGDDIWLIVQDKGIGIAPAHLNRIFEEFFQVENHMIRRHNGMGLGLAITKAVVIAHGGRVWADSPGLNEGATFYISLPIA